MYVAITRARRRLYLTLAQSRMLHGQTRYNIPSRFVGELPPELVQWLSPYRRRTVDVDDDEWKRVTEAPQATPPGVAMAHRPERAPREVRRGRDHRRARTRHRHAGAGQLPRRRREVAGAGLREAGSRLAASACVGCVARKSSTAADADGKNRSLPSCSSPIQRRSCSRSGRFARAKRTSMPLDSNSSCSSRSTPSAVTSMCDTACRSSTMQRGGRLGRGDERAQAVGDVARVGEEDRRVQAIDEDRGRVRAAFVVGEVVEAAVGGKPPQQRVARTRDLDQDARERQRDAEQHARQHAEHAARQRQRRWRGRTRGDRACSSVRHSPTSMSRTPAAIRIADSATRGSASSAGATNSTNSTSNAAAIHCASCVCAPLRVGGDRARRARADGKSGHQRRPRRCPRRARRARDRRRPCSRRLAASVRAMQDAFGEDEQREREAPGASDCRSRIVRLGSEGIGIEARNGGEVHDAARRRGRTPTRRGDRRPRRRSAPPARAGRTRASTSMSAISARPSASGVEVRIGQCERRVVDAQEERVARQRYAEQHGKLRADRG